MRKLFTTFRLHEPEDFAEKLWLVAAHLALLLAGGNLSSASSAALQTEHEQMLEQIPYLSTFADLSLFFFLFNNSDSLSEDDK